MITRNTYFYQENGTNLNGENQSQEVSVQVVLDRAKSVGTVYFNTTAYLMGETEDVVLSRPDSQFLTVDSDLDVLLEGDNLNSLKFQIP